MSGLHDVFDEIVADVPVYGDLDRAIEQADRERRHRYGAVVGLAAAAAVLVVIAGIVAASRDNDSAPPVSPSPTPVTPSPTPAKSQSPQTWADTPVVATDGEASWYVRDPLQVSRDAWFSVVTVHLDPKGERLEPNGSDPWGIQFVRPAEGSEYDARTAATSAYPTNGRMGLMVDRGDLNLLDDGCGYLRGQREGVPEGQEFCSTKRFAGPGDERARISSWGRRCGLYEGGPAPATCGDYVVGVAVERHDGLIGYVLVDGRGTPDFNPFPPDAMAAAAADPRLTLPERAFAVPPDQAVVTVVEDHFPGYRQDQASYPPEHPGYAQAWGRLGRLELSVTVRPAAETPACGRRSSLIECVERRVFGADDPTTVYVGAWDYEDLGSSYPKGSRASQREFVYVGPRHTVVVTESLVVKADQESLGADLDPRLIDFLLDPRLQ